MVIFSIRSKKFFILCRLFLDKFWPYSMSIRNKYSITFSSISCLRRNSMHSNRISSVNILSFTSWIIKLNSNHLNDAYWNMYRKRKKFCYLTFLSLVWMDIELHSLYSFSTSWLPSAFWHFFHNSVAILWRRWGIEVEKRSVLKHKKSPQKMWSLGILDAWIIFGWIVLLCYFVNTEKLKIQLKTFS